MPDENAKRFRFHIGMRNVKTAITTTLCALIYLLIGRNPTFACIGAIFGMGNSVDNSKLNGGNRLWGTVFGGVIGMLLFPVYCLFYPDGKPHFLLLVFLFIGTVILILTSLFFKWPGAIQPGGVVLCIILFNTPVDTYIQYSLNRMLDTAIGVILAIAIEYLFPRERIVKILVKLKLRKPEDLELE
jgi:uncharacterized membrane protein YgaE (UPF0421/DUF939 family)